MAAARASAEKIQGRNSTVALRYPLEPPIVEGAVATVSTTFLEPAYVEPDASRCEPGGEPSIPFANAGAFGAKRTSVIREDARRLADEQGRAVLAIWPREEVVRRGKKRPPVSVSLRADGTGSVRIAQTPGSDPLEPLLDMIGPSLPGVTFEIVDVLGPPVGASHRGAVLAEVLGLQAALCADADGTVTVTSPSGGRASVRVDADGRVDVAVAAGDPLCATTLRSYVTGAVHQGLGAVLSEGIAVDDEGTIHDLTIRSFGILSPSATPPISVTIEDDPRDPVVVGGAVLAATMGAAWNAAGRPPTWPGGEISK